MLSQKCGKNVSNKHQRVLVCRYLKITIYHLLKKLSSKESYSLLIPLINHQPSWQKYFDSLFPNIKLPWKVIYLTACKATANSHLRCFCYKFINNVLHLNEKFFQFGKNQFPLYSFCRRLHFLVLLMNQRIT